MTVKTVMVHIDADDKTENHIRVARCVADKFGASAIGVSAFAVEPPFISEGVVIKEMTEDDVERKKAELAAKGNRIQNVGGFDREKFEWRWGVEYPTVFLVSEARAADVVVVKRHQQKVDAFNLIDPAEVMLRIGRPTLFVPEQVTELVADRIVVGWKDSREARLAVRDALPFLEKASQVTLLEICPADEQDKARHRLRDVARYLQRHGAKSQIEVRVHMSETDARHLLRLASEENADLIVTGGYGHSRLGEWVFGGMTKDLLDEAPVCLLMSH
jgi:nucleotide-binding universal stress UspA family protein